MCALLKNGYSSAGRWNVLFMSVRSIWSLVLLRPAVPWLIFCLDDLSKFPTVTELLSISPFSCALVRCCSVVHSCYILLMIGPLCHCMVTLFVSCNWFRLKVFCLIQAQPLLLAFGYHCTGCFSHLFPFNLCVSLKMKPRSPVGSTVWVCFWVTVCTSPPCPILSNLCLFVLLPRWQHVQLWTV